MMKIISFVFLAVSFSAMAHEPGQFEIDNDLVEQIYEENTGPKPSKAGRPVGGFTVAPQVSFFAPSQMKLTNNYYEVPYDNFGSLPFFTVEATKVLFSFGPFNLRGSGGAGYSYKEGNVSVFPKTSTDSRTSVMRLHTLPLFIGPQIEFTGLPYVTPFLVGQVGAQWLYQVGSLDGMEQGFWVPYYELGGGLNLFESVATRDAWFGGLTVSALTHTSFSSEQTVKGLSWNLGARILF